MNMLYEEKQYFTWLIDLLRPEKFDVVVTVGRKATALLRALLDLMPEFKVTWDWDRVISSDALPYLPMNWLKGKRLLVFNEMIHRGRSTRETIQAIEKNTPGASGSVETAAFIVHEMFDREGTWRTQDYDPDSTRPTPDYSIFRRVSNDLYELIQEDLINTLRNKGALLLDTEHIESTFTYVLPHRRFLDSLSSFGVPVEYEQESQDAFPGITVREPVLCDEARLRASIPSGTDLLADGPKKVRMVRRGPKSFAFIPIWYPPVPKNALQEGPGWSAPEYMRRALDACPRERLPDFAFHLTSLVAGVELLRSVWAGLAPMIGKGVEPDTLRCDNKPGSPLGHLRALYPLLDFKGLETTIDAAISIHKDSTACRRFQKASEHGSHRPIVVNTQSRRSACQKVLIDLMRQQREFTVGEDWFDDDESFETSRLPAFSWEDFWTAGQSLGIDEPTLSIVMDTCIDNAILKSTQVAAFRKSQDFIVRGYEPDSEFAQQALERMAHGAEELFPECALT